MKLVKSGAQAVELAAKCPASTHDRPDLLRVSRGGHQRLAMTLQLHAPRLQLVHRGVPVRQGVRHSRLERRCSLRLLGHVRISICDRAICSQVQGAHLAFMDLNARWSRVVQVFQVFTRVNPG